MCVCCVGMCMHMHVCACRRRRQLLVRGIVWDCGVPPRDCVSYHRDIQQIYFLIQQIFTSEYKDKLIVTLARKRSWVLRGRQSHVQLNRMPGSCAVAGSEAEAWRDQCLQHRQGAWEDFTWAATFQACQEDEWIFVPVGQGRERALQAEASTCASPGNLGTCDTSRGQRVILTGRGSGSYGERSSR